MNRKTGRRGFLEASALVSAGLAMGPGAARAERRALRIGVIGVGGRGYTLLRTMLSMGNLAFPALCDIRPERVGIGSDMVEKAGHPRPEGYTRDEWVFQDLIGRDDLDAVIIATPWDWHARMAVAAMRAGKYAGVEVPAAITLDECWDLVRAHEETGVPCMMLENWSYRRDNLAVLNMIRLGLLGETVHGQCAYSHDCVTYFFDKEGRPRWQGGFLLNRNCDPYPTHGLGPVLSWMDIHCGDRFATLTSTASGAFGVNAYYRKNFGEDHPMAERKIRQGDLVTTVVKTVRGKTILISNDMVLPRPYDNRWLVQGTNGIYSHEREAVYIEGHSPQSHQWDPFGPWQDRYDHKIWTNAPADVLEHGHGGCDYICLDAFLGAVAARTQTPIDVYDSVAMSCVIPLSEASIGNGSAPVECPDFTGGKWEKRKPYFALDMGA